MSIALTIISESEHELIGVTDSKQILMLKAHEGPEVDIIDRLLMPFGLVGSGVAPDVLITLKQSLSCGVELMTPAFPQYFLLLASIGNIAKHISLAC
ncbi:hypothetical protein CTI12_AA420730 [Artemisia annua]|uniref:Uncharacterized protein n=1 Tax=Artemisia annua TaxID=35608 RepID=A0A2U1M4H3_ARTAN|nr:hypothetical protein CTI12_AA420730 [Artemisia annua]